MRFLVDAQLPPALARWLSDRGHEAEHVLDLGLMKAGDRAIWATAGKTGAVVITKDQDFVTLLSIAPNSAAVVWVRVANTTRHALLKPLLPAADGAAATCTLSPAERSPYTNHQPPLRRRPTP